MAENGQDSSNQLKNAAGSRPASARGTMHWFAYLGPEPPSPEDKEARIRNLKEKQNEERQKKLEEIKAQALAAQHFKEQKEQERRHRLEELRIREDERRKQVEQRKKAIHDAERDRLESILKRNQEREARIEAKRRNERSSMVFAFGSSTPRMLDPVDSTTTFWGHRRATSTQNIPSSTVQLTRRQSERDLDAGSKKRAISVNGLERSTEDMRMSTSMYEIFHWEDGSGPPLATNPSTTAQTIRRSTSSNFGVGPQVPAGCVSGYVGRKRTDLMPTIPVRDIASAPVRRPFARSPASSRPSSSLSQQSTSSVTSSVSLRQRPPSRQPRPISIAITGVTHDLKPEAKKPEMKPPLPKARKASVGSKDKAKKKQITSPTEDSPKTLASPVTDANVVPTQPENEVHNNNVQKSESKEAECTENKDDKGQQPPTQEIISNNTVLENIEKNEPENTHQTLVQINNEVNIKSISSENCTNVEQSGKDSTIEVTKGSELDDGITDMSASLSAKARITTEEEAKAALAERRRLAREEAERQAELERQRIEEEARRELERQQREEEQQRMLIEQQRQAEQERLEEAIKEAKKREEEERLKREEEQRLKLIKEEAERKAREEAERQKAELQERLKNEEKEREARRKRVEAIMLRTRGKMNSNSQSQNDDKNEDSKSEKINGSKSDVAENGHKSEKNLDRVDNIIPVDSIKNANTVSVETLSTDDNLNSNSGWQRNSQQDLLM